MISSDLFVCLICTCNSVSFPSHCCDILSLEEKCLREKVGSHMTERVRRNERKGKNLEDPLSPGDRLVYKCDNGYRLYGKRKRTCLSDGEYNHEMPTCRQTTSKCVCVWGGG